MDVRIEVGLRRVGLMKKRWLLERVSSLVQLATKIVMYSYVEKIRYIRNPRYF